MQSPVFISHVKHAPLAASSVIGRIAELQKIADALATGDDLLLLNGMGGVGKTTLAGFYMERYAERYGHIAWISCSGDFRSDLVNQLNRQRIPSLPDTQNVPELFAAMIQSMEDMPGPNLLIADNLNTLAQIDDLAQHKAVFPRNWKMLITARCNTGAFPDHAIGVLSEPEAKALFLRHYPLRAADTESQLQDLLRKTGRHTLAVEFIAKTLAQLPSWNLERMLRHLNEKGLADLGSAATVTTAHSKDMRVLMEEYLQAIFEVNLGALGERSGELLAQMALFPAQPHPFQLLCQMLGCDAESEKDLLATSLNHLKNNGILEDLSPDGWYLHPLLQEVARQKWPPRYDAAASILSKLENALYNLPLPESLPLLPYAVAIVERLRFEDARLARVCWTISVRYYDIGDFPNSERFIQTANRLYVSVEDNMNIGVTLGQLGNLALDQGDFRKAMGYYEQYKQINELAFNTSPESLNLKRSLAVSYFKLGKVSQSLGELEKALDYYQKYNQYHEDLYNANPKTEMWKSGLAISYNFLGNVCKEQGKLDEALAYYQKYNLHQEELYESNPKSEKWKNDLAISYRKLGIIFQEQSKMDEALSFFERDLKLTEELYDANPARAEWWFGLATSYIWLGDLHKEMGNPKLAIPLFQKALPLLEKLSERTPIPRYLIQLEWVRKALE